MNIAPLLRESSELAARGSTSRCDFSLPDDLWQVDADEGQISQVVHNLVLNAGQAMPGGGVITVVARNQVVDAHAERLPLSPGRYVLISISDPGGGIPPEHVSRVFDPYFSTKEHGTGLGLATTYSIVKRHDGFITFETGPAGTTFYVYLPASQQPAPETVRTLQDAPHGKGRLLVG